MSRSGYHDDFGEEWALIRWRGAVASAIRGARGQAFLREMRDALDAMPNKRLIREEIAKDGEVCAIGSVFVARGVDCEQIDPEDYEDVANRAGVAEALVREIEYMNDEWQEYPRESAIPEEERRWRRMRAWVESQIAKEDGDGA